MIVVRPARAGDEPAIADVSASALATLRQVYRPTPAAISRKRDLALLPRLVALADDRLVGTVEYARGEDRLHLMGLFVLASHRRKGIGRALVDELQRVAAGCPLSLNTVRETGNVPIFERLGFAVVREEPATELVGEGPLHDVFMTRPLIRD